jgi:hypothetical protein
MDRDLLKLSLNESDLIFSGDNGKPLRPNTVTTAWSVLAKKPASE